MKRFTRQPIVLDTDTKQLLCKVAEHEAERDGEPVNMSQTVRRLIRKEARQLGVVVTPARAAQQQEKGKPPVAGKR